MDEDTFDIGMVVQHPVCDSLREGRDEAAAKAGPAGSAASTAAGSSGTSSSWILDLASACAKGDLTAFNTTVADSASSIEETPALAAHMALVREKITVLALVEYMASRPPHARSVPFSMIAECTGLPVKQMDWLLMRAMSRGLLKGTIDACPELAAGKQGAEAASGPSSGAGAMEDGGGVGASATGPESGIVHVTYVKPRTLDTAQVAKLGDRVEAWIGKVDEAHAFLEDHSKELIQ